MKKISFLLALLTIATPLWASPPEPRLDIIRRVFGLAAQNPQSGGPIPQTDYTTPSYIGGAAVAPLNLSMTGAFTSAANSNAFQATLTGGTSCSENSIFGTFKFASGVLGLACDPTGSTGVTNSYQNGVMGVFYGTNTGAGGQFGWVGGVGVYGSGWCAANNEHCWGMNAAASDLVSQTGNVEYGNEVDTSVASTTTSGAGVLLSMRGAAQAAVSFPAAEVQAPAGAGSYTSGFKCDDGSILVASVSCIDIGQAVAGGSQSNSMALYFRSHDNGGPITTFIQQQKGDVLMEAGVPFALFNPAPGPESYGVALTSASTLIVTNMLVKVNTAATDSVVPCTTADTLCLGFVQSVEASGQFLCNNTSTDCPVATVPGSKVKGILGTGTCSIGNNVLVDTTTNGDIKCQAGIPAQGAWVGIAISAQATVGLTVDIILKMQ